MWNNICTIWKCLLKSRSRGGFNLLWNYFPHTWIFSKCIGEYFFLKKSDTKCGLGRDSNPDPSALKPSECTTTPSTFSSMRKRKCSNENRKSVVYLLVTNTMTKKLLRVIFLQWIETSSAPWLKFKKKNSL